MCGIAGWIGPGNAVDSIEKALKTLNQRGPDHTGTFHKGNVHFGHARLAIIDTSANANQPFRTADSECALIYNGEIFNFRELRSELKADGQHFTTNSDTEVLFRLLEKHGIDALKKLNGFFAFAWLNGNSGEVLLARDRFGIKPLYYHQNAQSFFFASELKALLAMNIPREIDYDSLSQFFDLTYIPAPHTILKDVFKLPPGHYLQVKKGLSSSPTAWYQIENVNSFAGSYADAKSQLNTLLRKSVNMRLIADVPVGTFLSGGIDSAIVTILASQHQHKIEAFTVSFPEEPFFDESSYAAEVAKKHGIKHHILPIQGSDIRESMMSVLDYMDEPFGDSSAIAMNLLSRKVSGSLRVALSGDGADELFGGYNKHRALLRSEDPGLTEKMIIQSRRIWNQLPSSRNGLLMNRIRQAARFANLAGKSHAEKYWQLATFNDPAIIHELLPDGPKDERRSFLLRHMKGKSPLNEMLLSDIAMVLPDDMLTKVDRMSMCHSLEVRVPFLDYRVAELAMSLPPHFKLNRNQGKIILRETFAELLPESVLNRSKKGFEVPLGKWLRKHLSELTHYLLAADRIRDQGVLNAAMVARILNDFYKGNDRNATLVWQILVFQHWHKKHLES